MKKCKSYFVLLLAVMLLAGISIQTFAAQPDDARAVQGCTHQYVRTQDVYTYWQIDGTRHMKQVMPSYLCTICGDVKFGEAVTAQEAHSFHHSYTYNNFHSGSEHYNEIKSQCACGYSYTSWSSYPCPGNGNCILPFSVEPVLTEK